VGDREGSLVNIAHSEMVEKELDILIERRSQKGETEPDEREELWKESVRRYNEQHQEELRAEWHGYFCRLAGTLRARADEYDRRAAKLEEETS
jgi:hypothetical protein